MLLTVLLHYNIDHDSHQVHCRHQIRHTRELNLKSYTIIFHRNFETKYLPQKQTIEKNKHDKKWSVLTKYIYNFTKMQMLILFSPCFCAFFFFKVLSHVGLEGSSFATSLLDWMQVSLPLSGLFFSFLGRRAHTARWSAVGQNGSYWLGGHRITGPHDTNNPNTQRHGLFSKRTTW